MGKFYRQPGSQSSLGRPITIHSSRAPLPGLVQVVQVFICPWLQSCPAYLGRSRHSPNIRIRALGGIIIAKRSNIGSNRPFSPRRGAEQRAVVDASSAHTVRSVSEAFVCRSTHPARCEHRRMKRGAGASVFGYFWGNAKSDWPRAAMERAGGKRAISFSKATRPSACRTEVYAIALTPGLRRGRL